MFNSVVAEVGVHPSRTHNRKHFAYHTHLGTGEIREITVPLSTSLIKHDVAISLVLNVDIVNVGWHDVPRS